MMRRKIIFLFALFILFFLNSFPAYCVTHSGTTIESNAELYYNEKSLSSEVTSVTVSRIYGLTLTPTDSAAAVDTGATYYFPHHVVNSGNASDLISFSLSGITPGWSACFVVDDDNDEIHETGETTTFDAYSLLRSEDASFYYFVALTAPSSEGTGEVTQTITSEGSDGAAFYGADGILYGGDDMINSTDAATAEGGLLTGLDIHRDDASGDIILSWLGGNAGIHYIQNTYIHSFSGSSTEATNVSSPFTVEVSAGDGITRYYRVAKPGSGTLSTLETAVKFDLSCPVNYRAFSFPLVFTNEARSGLNNLIDNQVTAGSIPSLADRLYSFQGSNWLQAYLKTGVGWQGTLTGLTGDKGAWLYIVPDHPSKTVTFVGMVPTAESVAINLINGFNSVGSVFPVTVDLDDSGLASILTPGSIPATADRVYSYQNGAWLQAYLKTGVGFVGTLTSLSPGQGYWIYKQGAAATWTYSRPY